MGQRLQPPSQGTALEAASLLDTTPPHSPAVSKATGRGVWGGLSCLVDLLGDLGFGAKAASYWREGEEKRWW